MCGSVVECDQCIKCDTKALELISSPVPQYPISHHSVSELRSMEAIVHMVDKKMASSMFFSYHDTLRLQKCLIYKRNLVI